MERRFQPVVHYDYDYVYDNDDDEDDDDEVTISDETYLENYLRHDFQYESDCSMDKVEPISTKGYSVNPEKPAINNFVTTRRILTKGYSLADHEEEPRNNDFVNSRRISTKGYNKLLLIPLKSFEKCHIQNKKKFRSSIHTVPSHQSIKDEVNLNKTILTDKRRQSSKRKSSNTDKMKMVMSPNEFKEKFGHSSRDSFDTLKTANSRTSRRISVDIRDEPHGVPITSDEDEGRFLQDIYEDSNGISTESEHRRMKSGNSFESVEQRKQERRRTFEAIQNELQTIEELDRSLNDDNKSLSEEEISKPEYADVYRNNKKYFNEQNESFIDDVQTEELMSKNDDSGKSNGISITRKPSASMTELMRKYSIVNSWTPPIDQYQTSNQENDIQQIGLSEKSDSAEKLGRNTQPGRTNCRHEIGNYDQIHRSFASKKSKFSSYEGLCENRDSQNRFQLEEVDTNTKHTRKVEKARRDSSHVSEQPVKPSKQEVTGIWDYTMERLTELDRLEKNNASRGKMTSSTTNSDQSRIDHQQDCDLDLRTRSNGAVSDQFDLSQNTLSNKTRHMSHTKKMNRQIDLTRKISRKTTASYKGSKQQQGIRSALMETYPEESKPITSYEQQEQQDFDEHKQVPSSIHQQREKTTSTKKSSSSRRFSIWSRKKSTARKSSLERENDDVVKESRWKKIKETFIGRDK